MPRKDWEAIAFKEFDAMDKDWQAEWAPLRKRVSRRRG